jgi:hypothetical protein
VGSVLSAADLAWLEGALGSCGLLQRTASLDLACVDADLTGALQSVRARPPASHSTAPLLEKCPIKSLLDSLVHVHARAREPALHLCRASLKQHGDPGILGEDRGTQGHLSPL